MALLLQTLDEEMVLQERYGGNLALRLESGKFVGQYGGRAEWGKSGKGEEGVLVEVKAGLDLRGKRWMLFTILT